MTQVTVRYFAAFREACGIETETVESQGASVSELFAECQARHPSLQNYSASLVAINDNMADWDCPLSEGDEILFFPPVAGG
jgi:molybdopterin synthase sulfur carrier subunit